MKGIRKDKIAGILVRFLGAECVLLVVVVIIFIGMKVTRKSSDAKELSDASAQVHEQQAEGAVEGKKPDQNGSAGEEKETKEPEPELSEEEMQELVLKEQKEAKRRELLVTAELQAKSYDYDAAVKTIKSYEDDYKEYDDMKAAIKTYKEEKDKLVLYGAYDGIDQISHVFFHSLIADTSKAFDGDRMSNGYNYWMTTVDEFNRMMKQMYEDGYVLVSIHDVAKEEVQKDGTTKMVPGDIMLPPDKKPFVLSQDDVNFYEYMRKDGFAKRIVIDENGYPACEMDKDGKLSTARDYDVVPLLEKFIEEHPDFSYRGARGIIGVTGYEGVMGYRTNEPDSKTYEKDLKQAKAVADRLKEIGWEFASHSYGHWHMGKETAARVKQDTKHWDSDIASIVGDTDIYLYPYGEDIIDGVGKYTGEKYDTLTSYGFKYFCGVYAHPWIQVNHDYVRMSRRNLDGFTMHFHPDRLKDLFDVEKTIDEARPAFK